MIRYKYKKERREDVKELLIIIVLIASVVHDIHSWKISNRIILSGFLIGSIFVILEHRAVNAAFGLLIPVIVLFPLFYIRALGAGDIKLFSLLGYLSGSDIIIRLMLYALFYGAVLSIIQIVRKGNLKIRLRYLTRYLSTYFKTGKFTIYYEKDKDGLDAAIHFSIAILLAYLTHIVCRIS